MGRAGAGGGGGRSFSSGGHSSSRSSGGHRSSSHSSGSRAGGSGSSRSGGPSYRPGYRSPSGPAYGGYRPPPPPPPYGYRGGHGYGHGRPRRGCLPSLVSVLVGVLLILAIVSIANSSLGGGVAPSTANREPLDAGNAFRNDCVIDELGWVDNAGKTARGLRGFYDRTGVQPFVYLKAYDPDLVTDDEKVEFAEAWYDMYIGDEVTFLFVYFGEADADEDVGYMAYVGGKQTGAVMDAEAVEIFWDYLDQNWYSSKSTDDVLVDSFTSTARRVMARSTTMADVARNLAIGATAIGFVAIVIAAMRLKRRHEAERAAEVESILNADIHSPPGTGGGSGDDMLDKYI